MLIRREVPADIDAIRDITTAAFAPTETRGVVEATLIDELRAGDAWLPELSMVAIDTNMTVIGHVVCSRGHVEEVPVLALGPIAVRPDAQGRGVGHALMHAVLGAGDALGEPLVALLGNPAFYTRFGFKLAEEYDISPPQPAWRPHFQVRALAAYTPKIRGAFAYAEDFDAAS